MRSKLLRSRNVPAFEGRLVGRPGSVRSTWEFAYVFFDNSWVGLRGLLSIDILVYIYCESVNSYLMSFLSETTYNTSLQDKLTMIIVKLFTIWRNLA